MKKLFLYFTVILCIVLGFTSCSEKVETTTLKLDLLQTKSKTILPKTAVYISYYIVDGKGPNNNTFSIRTTKSHLNIEGLVTGKWLITATGCNSSDIALVKGNCQMDLSKDKRKGKIYLDKLIGKGSLKLKVNWYTFNTLANQVLKVKLVKENDKTNILKDDEILIDYNKKEATIKKSGIPSGSYKIIGSLTSNNKTIAGFAEAVRIVSNQTSGSGTVISMHRDDSSSSTSLVIGTNMETPIQGEIVGVKEKVALGSTLNASFNRGGAQIKNVRLEWYYDGELKSTEETYTFTPSSGSHRLDCIVYKPEATASCGSASVTFKVEALFKNQKPVVIDQLSLNQKGVDFTNVDEIKFVDKNLFVTISHTNPAVNLCSISQDQIFPIKTYHDTKFSNIEGLTTAHPNKMIAFTSTDKHLIQTFSVNPNTYELEDKGTCVEFRKQFPDKIDKIDSEHHKAWHTFEYKRFLKPTFTPDGKFMNYGAKSTQIPFNFAEVVQDNKVEFLWSGGRFTSPFVEELGKQWYPFDTTYTNAVQGKQGYMALSKLNRGVFCVNYFSLIPGVYQWCLSLDDDEQVSITGFKKGRPAQVTEEPIKALFLTPYRFIWLQSRKLGILGYDYVIGKDKYKPANFITEIDNKDNHAQHLVEATDMVLNPQKNMIAVSVSGGIQFFEINANNDNITASHFVNLGSLKVEQLDWSDDGKYVIACSHDKHKVSLIKMPEL